VVNCSWINPDLDELGKMPTRWYPTSAYARLLIPELLPPTVQKVIYLDCDLIVDRDLYGLWRMDPMDNYLLAVGGRPIGSFHLRNHPHPNLQAHRSDPAFNSGVMVINLRLWREDEVAKKVLEFCAGWPELCRFADQDGLNAICAGRWGGLDNSWNQGMKRYEHRPGNAVLHFAGGVKPWIPSSQLFPRQDARAKAVRIFDECLKASGWFTPVELLRFRALRAAYPWGS
jgi:lipopolysaccharide biosynthesis glycosyltransferase